MTIPHSYAKQKFYNEVREYDASLEPWLRAEYRNLSDAEQAFYQYKSEKEKSKLTLIEKIRNWFKIFKFDMNFTQKQIEDYLSRSRDHYDLEQREKNVMNGNVRFA